MTLMVTSGSLGKHLRREEYVCVCWPSETTNHRVEYTLSAEGDFGYGYMGSGAGDGGVVSPLGL